MNIKPKYSASTINTPAIADNLYKLGYSASKRYTGEKPYITTYKESGNYRDCNVLVASTTDYHTTNPAAFLAIASQWEGEGFHVGEWVKCLLNDRILRLTEDNSPIPNGEDEERLAYAVCNPLHYTKCTPEDLIAHFEGKGENLFDLKKLGEALTDPYPLDALWNEPKQPQLSEAEQIVRRLAEWAEATKEPFPIELTSIVEASMDYISKLEKNNHGTIFKTKMPNTRGSILSR